MSTCLPSSVVKLFRCYPSFAGRGVSATISLCAVAGNQICVPNSMSNRRRDPDASIVTSCCDQGNKCKKCCPTQFSRDANTQKQMSVR